MILRPMKTINALYHLLLDLFIKLAIFSTINFSNMCLSFERLRVIREYRSPRSIRSFTKVLILLLPVVLSPYYIYLSEKTNDKNSWSPYYIAVLVALVFGALQGVQDKLDDPFDGMSEDDINLDTVSDINH